MKFLSKRNIIILIVIVAVVGFFIWKGQSKTPTEIVTAKTVRGNLIQTISPSGSVKSKTEINLNFDTSGRIASINVKVGDEVKSGQLLARIDTRNLESAVKQAEADLAKAQGNFDSYVAGATPEVIAQYEADLLKAQANLNKAKIDLENLKAGLKQAYDNAYENQITNLQGAISPMETAMTDVDSVLGLENSSANDTFDKAVVDLDNRTFYYSQAKISLVDARAKIDSAKNSVNSLSSISDRNLIDIAALKMQEALEAVGKVLGDTWTVLDKLDVANPSNNLSTATVTAKKTTLDTDRSSITSKRATISGGIQAISSAKLNFGLEIGSAGASQLSQYEGSVKIYEAAVISAQAALDAKTASPREVDLSAYRAAVKSASANLDSARANLSKAFIYAPVDGIITQKNNEVGESNALTSPVFVMLANSNYEIETNVSESDITKVSVGQETQITLDAFGDDFIFKGKITMIDPAETLISDVVYYKVKVAIDHDESLKNGRNIAEDNLKNIKAGMTANITISTNHKDNVLMIPERAVISQGDKKIVRVLTDVKKQIFVEKEIETGLRGDEGMIEIVSGLNEGEEVITFMKNS